MRKVKTEKSQKLCPCLVLVDPFLRVEELEFG